MDDVTRRRLLTTGLVFGTASITTGMAAAAIPNALNTTLPNDDEINPRPTTVATKKQSAPSACPKRCKRTIDPRNRCAKVRA